jgi:flavin-dependent dehydrogenase
MSHLYDTDVFVVGGGPAGLAAAIAARNRGLRVLVVDRDTPPVDKACGEGLMPDSLTVLRQLGVSLDGCVAGEFRGIRFVGPECEAAAEFPQGRGHGIRRVVLHERLVNEAEAAGVETLWRARIAFEADVVSVNGVPVRYKWLVGADGQNSRVRHWAGLGSGDVRQQRIGLRRHFRVPEWSDYVEIFWSDAGQAYVTPVGKNEICVALISRARFSSFAAGLAQFSSLAQKLQDAIPCTQVRGALTVSRHLKRVTSGNVALIGDASGSVDAITGEGLAIAFRQALALADGMANNELSAYEQAHQKIIALPEFMARSMLLMDKHPLLRRQALRAFARKPKLFRRLLRVHVGEVPLARVGAGTLADIGWNIMTTRSARITAPEATGDHVS